MKILGNPNLYVKGTSLFTAFRGDGSTRFWSNKVQTSQFQTSINLGGINGGAGNPLLINIPDTPDVSIDLTMANFIMEAQASNVGATITGNGKVPHREVVTFGADGKASISGIPVVPLGSSNSSLSGTLKKISKETINEGVVFEYNEDSNSYYFSYDGATEGAVGCVEYYIEKPDALQYAISARPEPEILRGVIRMDLYYADVNTDPNKGSHVGYIYITIPRLQWTAETNIEGSSTNPAATAVKAKALGAEIDEGTGCTEDDKLTLAYVTVELLGNDWTESAERMFAAVNPINLAPGGTKVIACKYIDGMLVNNLTPASEYVEFAVENDSTVVTVDANGKVTAGEASGSANITVTPKKGLSNPKNLSLTVEVVVK